MNVNTIQEKQAQIRVAFPKSEDSEQLEWVRCYHEHLLPVPVPRLTRIASLLDQLEAGVRHYFLIAKFGTGFIRYALTELGILFCSWKPTLIPCSYKQWKNVSLQDRQIQRV